MVTMRDTRKSALRQCNVVQDVSSRTTMGSDDLTLGKGIGDASDSSLSALTQLGNSSSLFDLTRGTDQNDGQPLAVVCLENGKVVLHLSEHIKPYIDREGLNHTHSDIRRAHKAASKFRVRNTTPKLLEFEAPSGSYEQDDDFLSTTQADGSRPFQVAPARRGRPITRTRRDSQRSFSMDETDNDAPAEDSDIDAAISETMAPTRMARSFYIHEEAKVVAFLDNRLDKIQQLSDKRIAKAWIKGICPKKQAKFPYQDKKRKKELGLDAEVPGFWPSDVEYKEPDHIRKEDRKRLLLHLLRLRPTPEEVKEWNKGCIEAHPTHRLQGWTRFLRELAPPESVDDINNVKPYKVKQRKEYIKQLYDVAQMEQDYVFEGMDVQYQCPEDEEPPREFKLATKRRAASCTCGDDSRERSTGSCEGRKHANVKRPRHDSASTSTTPPRPQVQLLAPATRAEDPSVNEAATFPSPVHGDMIMDTVPSSTSGEVRAEVDAKPCLNPTIEPHYLSRHNQHGVPTEADWQASRYDVAMHLEREREQARAQETAQMAAQQHHWQQTPPPVTTSFGSDTSAVRPVYDPYQAHVGGQTMFPGQQDYKFDQNQDRYNHHNEPTHLPSNIVPVYHAPQIPQPHFHTVPSTPMFSPMDLMYSTGLPPSRQGPSAQQNIGGMSVGPTPQPTTMTLPPPKFKYEPPSSYDHLYPYQNNADGQQNQFMPPQHAGDAYQQIFPHGFPTPQHHPPHHYQTEGYQYPLASPAAYKAPHTDYMGHPSGFASAQHM